MPLREFACPACGHYEEVFNWSVDPTKVPRPSCTCGTTMKLLFSIPKMDTSDHFHPFDYTAPPTAEYPNGRKYHIDNLHKLRQVEHDSLASGHNVRFDAYSGNPGNPDPVDGYGPEYWDGTNNGTGKAFAFAE